ncbi:MAG: hypothetical protein DRP62_07180 [Planctomycetota bacterium]|nr:MAG: hypothetical protein DRP62_07180 [Planctomycetota bacterium]
MKENKIERGLTAHKKKEAGEGTIFLVVSVEDPMVISELIEMPCVCNTYLLPDGYILETKGNTSTLTATIIGISGVSGVKIERILEGRSSNKPSLKERILKEIQLNGGI